MNEQKMVVYFSDAKRGYIGPFGPYDEAKIQAGTVIIADQEPIAIWEESRKVWNCLVSGATKGDWTKVEIVSTGR